MDFEEFAAVYHAYAEQRDADFKDRWECMRMLATVALQPHIDRKKGKLTPDKVLSFPWDKEAKKPERPKKEERKMTVEEQRSRMAELVKKLGDKLIS